MNSESNEKVLKFLDNLVKNEVKEAEKRIKGESASQEYKKLAKLCDSAIKSLTSGKSMDNQQIKNAYRKFDDNPDDFNAVKKLTESLLVLYANMQQPEPRKKVEQVTA